MKIIRIGAVWCPACLVMQKTWKKVKEEVNDIEIMEYDYDMDGDIVKTYQIGTKLPVFIFIDEEIERERLIGEYSYKELMDYINKYRR